MKVVSERSKKEKLKKSRVVCESVNCVTVSLTAALQDSSPPVTLVLLHC